MQKCLGRYLVFGLLAVMVSVIGLACSGAATQDFTVTSSTDSGHSHTVIISGADVDNPTADKTLTSSATGATPHTHTVKLTKQDYESIKKGEQVTVTASPAGANNHIHTFSIKKPASTGY